MNTRVMNRPLVIEEERILNKCMVIKEFYQQIAKKPSYWLVLLLLGITAFGFSIFNRTIHWDDFLKDYYLQTMWYSRWGMNVWAYLVGITDFMPFVDKFLSFLFLFVDAFLLSCILYILNGHGKNVWIYTSASSLFLTYPLIVEIWEYTGADYISTGNLALCLLAILYTVQMKRQHSIRELSIASILLILPVSSYEVSVFSYISIACFICFLRCIYYKEEALKWKESNATFLLYIVLPLIIAGVVRVVIAYILRMVFDLQEMPDGNTGIAWFQGATIISLFKATIQDYILSSLVYLPISIFLLFTILFIGIVCHRYTTNHRKGIFAWATLFFVSLFGLSILQGFPLQYRTAQTIQIFVALLAFLLLKELQEGRQWVFRLVLCSFFVLAWHQAIYTNKILALNNQRSDNEAIKVHHIGCELAKMKPTLPIVFVNGCKNGTWIDDRINVSRNTWNGSLFYSIRDKYSNISESHVVTQTALRNTTSLLISLRKYFSYYGYDFEIISPKQFCNRGTKKLEEIDNIGKSLKPYEIRKLDDVILVRFD